jgi:hypothetical protein
MRKLYSLILIFFSLAAKGNYWTQKANFGGGTRSYNCGFSIGSKGYLGMGNPPVSNDFWEYDPALNSWTQKANFGGAARYAAVGFSIGNKGYIGAGLYSDFWEWDQATNIWTQKTNYPGGAAIAAVAFSIGTKGYIGTGTSSGIVTNEFWEWDQGTDTWSQKSNFAGSPRWLAVGFSIGNKGYIGTGVDGSSNLYNDLWEWDQNTDLWTQKSSFSVGRVEAMGFSIGSYGYIGVGSIVWGVNDTNDLWQYNSVTDSWLKVADFPGGERELAVGFSIGCKGYFGAGIVNDANPHDDFWEYTPDSCFTGIEENTISNFQFQISPNPASEFIICSLPAEALAKAGLQFAAEKKVELTITNVEGKKVYSLQPETGNRKLETKIDISNLPNGIYFVTVDDGKQKAVKKFVKE